MARQLRVLAFDAVASEPRLDSVPNVFGDDRQMLAGKVLILVADLTDVNAVH